MRIAWFGKPLLVGVLAAAATAPFSAALADTIIDNFERVNAPSPWTFSNGPEFPGATGALTAGTGHSGKGAHLAYDLSHGGHYVAASYTLPSALSAAAVAFWVKSPANITLVLRVVDATGQNLQYSLRRPLENLDAASWYQHLVPLDTANSSWGGTTNDGKIHLPISALSILAADPLQAGAAGAIDFDDVMAVTTTAFDLAPGQQPLIPALPGSGDLLSRLGVNIHFTSDNRALDAAHAAELSWVRMDLTWPAVESVSNVYNWSAYDGLLSSLQSRDMKALLILDYGNHLYTGANNLPPTNAAAVQAFGNYAFAAARHFAGRGARLEIWNEPNISGFWPPEPSATQYLAMAQASIPRLHQGDAAVPVVTGGLSTFDFNFFSSYFAQGGGMGAQAIGVHPYECNPPEKLSDRLLFLRALVAQYLTNAPPVWDTEWGFSSASFGDGHSADARQRQAVLVARELLNAGAAGFPLIIYYDLRDDGTNATDPENNFGLLANDYSDKPAMTAVKTLTAVARGRRLSGFIHTSLSTLSAVRFDGRTNMVVAVWSSGAGGPVTVTVPTNTTATDFVGAPLALLDWTNRLAWLVYETNGPVYFSFPYTWQATNLAPALTPISNRTIHAGTTLYLTNTAAYQDAPPRNLTYQLLSSPAPAAGAWMDPLGGLFTWRPLLAQSDTTNDFGIAVSDDGIPSLGATQYFTVTVVAPAQPSFGDLTLYNGSLNASVFGETGPDYSVLTSTDLVNWVQLLSVGAPPMPFSFSTPLNPAERQRFYRARMGP